MWVRPPLFPMLLYYFQEVSIRTIYTLIAWILTAIIIWWYLPSLLKLAPLYFIYTNWEEAIIALLSISSLISIIWVSPLIAYQLLSFITPALLPREFLFMILSLLWWQTLLTLFLIISPFLFWQLFLLSPSSNFTPSLVYLENLSWDFFLSFLLLLVLTTIQKRLVVYITIIIIITTITDPFSSLLLLIPLSLALEFSFLFFLFIRFWLLPVASLHR